MGSTLNFRTVYYPSRQLGQCIVAGWILAWKVPQAQSCLGCVEGCFRRPQMPDLLSATGSPTEPTSLAVLWVQPGPGATGPRFARSVVSRIRGSKRAPPSDGSSPSGFLIPPSHRNTGNPSRRPVCTLADGGPSSRIALDRNGARSNRSWQRLPFRVVALPLSVFRSGP